MPLAPALADWLATRGHDAVHASNIALAFAQDATVLSVASREERVLVTADLDYARLLVLGRFQGPGLVLFRGGNYSEQEVRGLLGRALQVIPESELPYTIVVRDKTRIRRRRLPITPRE